MKFKKPEKQFFFAKIYWYFKIIFLLRNYFYNQINFISKKLLFISQNDFACEIRFKHYKMKKKIKNRIIK